MNRIEDLIRRFGWLASESYAPSRMDEPEPFVIILIATWSPKDFFLVESSAERINSLGLAVFLFDIDSFSTQTQIQSFFPGFPVVTQTPALAVFRNGTLTRFAAGDAVAETPLT